MQHVTVACRSISACRLTNDNLASALSHRIRFEDRQTSALESERYANNARSTIPNAACHRDSLARCSGVSGVGRRGLPLPPPATGWHLQAVLDLTLPDATISRRAAPIEQAIGTEGSHWHEGR